MKKTEDGDDIVMRFYEWAGKQGVATITVPPGVTGAAVTNLMKEPETNPLVTASRTVKPPLRPLALQLCGLRMEIVAQNSGMQL
jgi:alpha-mannosidase